MCEWFTFANIQYIWIEIRQSILLWSLSLMLPSPFNLECSSSHVCSENLQCCANQLMGIIVYALRGLTVFKGHAVSIAPAPSFGRGSRTDDYATHYESEG